MRNFCPDCGERIDDMKHACPVSGTYEARKDLTFNRVVTTQRTAKRWKSTMLGSIFGMIAGFALFMAGASMKGSSGDAGLALVVVGMVITISFGIMFAYAKTRAWWDHE